MERKHTVSSCPCAPVAGGLAFAGRVGRNRARAAVGGAPLLLALALAGALLPASAAAQANLIPNLPTGWAWPLVPRVTNDATLTSVPAPAYLVEGTPVYLNSAWRNIGTASSGAFHNNTVLDGETVLVDRSCASLAAGAAAQGINGGPFYVLGGRHTLELRVDSGGAVAESDETDNRIARQWSWRAGFLPAGSYGLRGTPPPPPQGGWSSIPAGQDKYENCTGIGFSSDVGWSVVYIYSFGEAADYDLKLFNRTTNASDGYKSPLAWSTRRGRGVEAAVINGHNVGTNDYEIGVYRYAGEDSFYFAHAVGQSLAWGDSIGGGFARRQMVQVFDVTVPTEGIGTVTVTLQMATTEPSVVLAWADRAFQTGGLPDLSLNAATGEDGRARLHAPAGAAGHYAVILYRDPDWGTGPRSFTLKVERAQPDLAPFAPAGWHSPLVPRRSQDGTPTSVALPDTLPAYTTGAYFNWAVRNDGGTTCPATSSTRLFVDGSVIRALSTPALGAGETYAVNPDWHWEVPAGRHTASMQADFAGALAEMSEANNAYGEQYCWAPVTTAPLGDMGWDPVPPPIFGGTEAIPAGGETVWYNCNGRRLPVAANGVWWQGFAIAPGAGDDYDVRLFEALRGAKNGFAEPLAVSGWGANQTDYVLVNLNATPRRPFDVGVIKMSGSSSYHPQYVESVTLGNAGAIALAPYTANWYEILQLREWYFTPGNWILHLDNLSPALRFGMTFHPADQPYHGKLSGPAAYPAAAGADVWLEVPVTTAGWYCLAVWRQDMNELYGGTYQLTINPGGTPVPDGPPAPEVTALAGASPNPFNPRTTIAFDLAATGRARLAVYDLRGTLVRALLDADLAAGRHEVIWDGRDSFGRLAPSGSYVARLAAGGVEQARKLTLLK